MRTQGFAKLIFSLCLPSFLTFGLSACGSLSTNGFTGSTGGGGGGTTTASLSSINHIIFLAQENRSFDHYFGALREYWAQNGYQDQPFDGLSQFASPAGLAPSNPGCDPTLPPPNDCKFDPAHPVTSYHLQTMCLENTSP